VHEEERDKDREGERETERQRERERECVCEVRGKRVRDQWKQSLCARETEGRERQKRRGRKKGILFGMCIKISTVLHAYFPPNLCVYTRVPMPSLCCALTFLLVPVATCGAESSTSI